MKKFKVALYLRLSKEDENASESTSIINQKIMLTDFVNNNKDLELVSVKIDDGYSGSNFNRPAFKELMEDIKNRKVNCIVVKDFSRFGRDFIEVGRYLEEIFPFMNVRFISVNDNYDSFKSENSTDSLIIPFKNLINDSYLRDISLKIRSSLDVKRKNGDFIGSFATYGYLKDEKNKNKLIIDEIACKVVQEIFKLKIEGYSADKIAKRLNDDGILSPMEHKKMLGLKFDTGFKKNTKALWNATSIIRILENPIYIGTLEQHKTTTPNYKVKKTVVVPKEERITIYNNHEAIIEKEIFENVQRLMLFDMRIAPNREQVYLFSGISFCGECGSNLIRKNRGTKEKPYVYYICNNAKNKCGCKGTSINENHLEEIVFHTIKSQINHIIDLEKMIKMMDNLPYTSREIKKVDERIKLKNQELIKYQNIKLKLYEDLKNNILTEQEYREFNILYTDKINEIKSLIQKFENEIDLLINEKKSSQVWINYFKEYKNIKSLSRELVVNLIEKIVIYKDKIVDIHFKYKNEYDNLLNYIENIDKLQVAYNG